MKHNIQAANGLTISQTNDPSDFFSKHAGELAVVGASAFQQPPEEFEKQVAERFNAASLAQIMRDGRRIVSFALYDVLKEYHWRFTLYRG